LLIEAVCREAFCPSVVWLVIDQFSIGELFDIEKESSPVLFSSSFLRGWQFGLLSGLSGCISQLLGCFVASMGYLSCVHFQDVARNFQTLSMQRVAHYQFGYFEEDHVF
jgi:hypothetical protein